MVWWITILIQEFDFDFCFLVDMFSTPQLCIYMILYTQLYLYIVYRTSYLSYLIQYIIIFIYIMSKSFSHFLVHLIILYTFFQRIYATIALFTHMTYIKLHENRICLYRHPHQITFCCIDIMYQITFCCIYILYVFKHNALNLHLTLSKLKY